MAQVRILIGTDRLHCVAFFDMVRDCKKNINSEIIRGKLTEKMAKLSLF